MYLIFSALLIVSIAFAFWKGGAPERLCALGFVVMATVQYLGTLIVGRVYGSVDIMSLTVDCLGLLGFTAVALVANRMWPLCIAAMQLIACVSHFEREISTRIEPLAYAIMRSGPTFIALVILAMGTTFHVYRVKRRGADSSWLPTFHPPDFWPTFLAK